MKLLWDEQGQIACEEHAPYPGSDTRVYGRWRAITTNERIDFAAEIGRPVSCETCDSIKRNAQAVQA